MIAEKLQADGYTLLPAVHTPHDILSAIASLERSFLEHAEDPAILKDEEGAIAGARDVLRLWPASTHLLQPEPLCNLLLALLGPEAAVVRVLYFDKPPGKGWALPWQKTGISRCKNMARSAASTSRRPRPACRMSKPRRNCSAA